MSRVAIPARLLVPVALLLFVAGVGGATAATGDEPAPTIQVFPRAVAPGEKLTIEGEGWPPLSLVSISVCGQLGLGTSTECDQASTRSVAADDDGRLRLGTVVVVPPAPCPCAVVAFVVGGDALARTALEIEGAPVRPLALVDATPELSVVDAKLRDTSSWTAWFGAPPSRVLEVRIRNVGDAPADEVELDVTWGRGDNPSGFVESPGPVAVAPGETVKVKVPVELGAFSFGRYTVAGEVRIQGGEGEPLTFAARTTSNAWGLIVVPAAIVLQLGLIAVRNRLRRRFARQEAEALARARTELDAVSRT